MQCLSKEKVAQRVTPGRIRWFHKEILEISSPGDSRAEPVAVVRKRRAEGEVVAPIILVHGFGQNRYAWHLPERSFANYLADQGFDVFNVDLRGHGRSDELGSSRSQGVDDYIRRDLPAVLSAVQSITGFDRSFMMGHSLGGLCVSATAARDTSKVAGVITVGSPHALGRGHLVLGSLLRSLGRTVGWAGVLRGSSARIPVDLVGKLVYAARFAFDSNLAPLPVRAWKPGTLAPAEMASYIRSFDSASFGTLDELVELATTGDLRSRETGESYTKLIEKSPLPMLALCGEADSLANPGSVKPIYERSQSLDKQYVKVDAGHADLLVGNQAPEQIWPVVSAWLHKRLGRVSQPVRFAPVLRAG